jgi:hypothetical protein
MLLMTGAGMAAASDPVSAPECAAQVCTINVFAKNLIAAPCVGSSVMAMYSTSSGATLIECSKFAEDGESRLFIYDRLSGDGKAFEFVGGRPFTAEGLAAAKTEGIEDKFASRPLCAAKARPVPAAGELIFLEKRPTGSDDAPYCYRVHTVTEGAGLTVRSDVGEELKPVPQKTAQEWVPLRQKLAPYLPAEEAAPAAGKSRTASVVSEKATLYSSPDDAGTGRAYLVKGDQVEIADDSKAGSGWYLAHYVTKTGKMIEKWMKAGDLNVAAR